MRRTFALSAIALLAALAALSAGAVAGPGAVRAATPLPACRYDDVLTRSRTYTYWWRPLLDTIYKLPRSYAPPGLVSTSGAGLNGGHSLRRLVIGDLKAMAAAARSAGAPLAVQSAYRSYSTQTLVFQREVERYGYKQALRQSARPGHSEHQLGTTIDFRSYGSYQAPWDHPDWGTTRAGTWLAANAWRYGFVMSYPQDAESRTCYVYEPWHFRYVGRERAAAVRTSELTLREWLWKVGRY